MKKIEFPYKKYFMQKPKFYYNNIMSFKPKYEYKTYYYSDKDNKYYYDVIISSNDDMYENIDMFTDYFNEKQRIRAKVKYENCTPLEYYKENEEEINKEFSNIKSPRVRMYEMREYIYRNVKEATLFKISSILSVFKYVENNRNIKMTDMKVLDPSSGWGDRLIAFTSMNVKEYIGFDPNENLQKGYNKIIKTITKFNNSKNHYEVIPDGFENSNYENYFDIVFTSPPYFDIEEYDNNEKQSIKKYSSQDKWKNIFFKKYIENCVKAVKSGGIIFIHISNNKEFKIVDFLMNEMKKYNVVKYKYFGLLGTSEKCFPIWSWIKN